MNNFNPLLLILALLLPTLLLAGEERSSTIFSIGKYASGKTEKYGNNLNINRSLKISEAEALDITVEGETENGYDFIIIYDQTKKMVRRLSGTLSEKFTVKGAMIYLNFISDGRNAADGVLVKITSSSLFNELKSRMADATLEVLRAGTGEAYKSLSEALERFKRLHTLVQSQNFDSVAEQAITELLTITKTYRGIAAKTSQIMSHHQDQFKIIEGLQTEIASNLEKLNKEQSRYDKLLSSTKSRLNNGNLGAVEQQKEQFSMAVYNRILVNLKAQQENWEALTRYQTRLESQLRGYSEKVGLLLYFLQINADLYEQAANVALMRNSQMVELNELTDLSELQKIIKGISTQEQEIKELLEQIQKTQFVVE